MSDTRISEKALRAFMERAYEKEGFEAEEARQIADVLMQAVRPVSMRYQRGRYGPPFDSHAVIAVQVRRHGNRLQIATGQPVQAERLRAALATLTPAAAPAVQISERTVAPWRETGWQAWGPRLAQ